MQPVHQPRPRVVLSGEEVARLIAAAPGVKYQAALSVAYGAGLRASEVVALKVTDVDSERMTLRVELLEQRVDIRVIQVLLGHKRLETTSLYTHVATETLRKVISPLETLPPS
jgi:site-specific recombinase XerD